ncbi:MAG: hypothetical protein MUC92_09730 [Fimbriimonadaceae bacterium]|jgi:acetyl/propionyl-CoA carboxylase alpha subunit|nr:hypothetical protein [Fimbriimonadaceae bacterium]
MRYLVNGVEAELGEDPSLRISPLVDRLVVAKNGRTRTALVKRRGDVLAISYAGKVYEIERFGVTGSHKIHHATGDIIAPMPGQIVEVLVSPGQKVAAGEKLVVLEAMKMQQALVAPFIGIVERVEVQFGQQVSDGQLLVFIADPKE